MELTEETPDGFYWNKRPWGWSIIQVWQHPDDAKRISYLGSEYAPRVRDALVDLDSVEVFPAITPDAVVEKR